MPLYIFSFMERNKKKRPWTQEEIDLLATLYPANGSKKWKKMAEGLSKKGFHRSEIEIRERWINFLDPSLNKSRWEDWELQKMYDMHDQVGTKWCLIQKFIGRTQNMIKNRFYGTLRNFIRFLVTRTDDRNESFNQLISKLSPKILNDIYKADNQFKFIGDEVKSVIYQMRFKIDKKVLSERIRQNRSIYDRLKAIVYRIFDQMRKGKESDQFSVYDEEEEVEIEEKEEDMVKEEVQNEEQEGKKVDEAQVGEDGHLGGSGLKVEAVEEMSDAHIYPFLTKDAAEIAFKVESPYYPFMSYSYPFDSHYTATPYSTL